jgi:hypothetical protein
MSLTREAEPRVGRPGGSRAGLLGAGESNPGGMLEMPVLFRMPDVAEMAPLTPPASPKSGLSAAPVAKPAENPASAPIEPKSASEAMGAAPVDAASEASAPSTPLASETTASASAAAAPRTLSKKAETWFDSHTKLLIVCFVVALAAVVYLARQKRRENSPLAQPPAASADWPDAQPHDATEIPPLSLETPAVKASTSLAPPHTPQATTALHTVPSAATSSSAPLASSDSPAPTPTHDAALFPWKQGDGSVRMAARSTNESPARREASADPNQGPPVLPPVIPPAPSPAPTTSPRGYQYERTGSGLY